VLFAISRIERLGGFANSITCSVSYFKNGYAILDAYSFVIIVLDEIRSV
jgi:hypothetical protein